ncbi:MAG: FAD:protein FMN transferase [Pseudomonadales bacterium]|jgi:thiamine biosynthesis lipoprotein
MKIPLTSIVWFRNLASIAISISLISGCEDRRDSTVEISGKTMGTTYHIKIVSDEIDSGTLKTDIDERLVQLNQVFSTYIPDSELSLLNRGNGDIQVSRELMKVLSLSSEIHHLSGGAFDPTVGPLVNLWGFGPSGPRNGVPSDEEISQAMARAGFTRLALQELTITKPRDLVIDLSAIAKGYAVDVVSDYLDAMGEHRYLVEIGGEVRASGRNDRHVPWVIGIEAPDMEVRRLQRTVPIRNMGMATSGDYRNFFEHEGQVYSHTLNPKTGWPVTHNLASVTVLHPRAGYADGLATAFSVMGEAATMELAEANKLLVLAIIRDQGAYKEVMSTELNRYLAGITGQKAEALIK